MGNIKNSLVYQVVLYRIWNGDSDIINIYDSFSNYSDAVAGIVGLCLSTKFADIEYNDLNDQLKDLTYLFDNSVEVKRIASYGDENFKYCFGILKIELK